MIQCRLISKLLIFCQVQLSRRWRTCRSLYRGNSFPGHGFAHVIDDGRRPNDAVFQRVFSNSSPSWETQLLYGLVSRRSARGRKYGGYGYGLPRRHGRWIVRGSRSVRALRDEKIELRKLRAKTAKSCLLSVSLFCDQKSFAHPDLAP